MKRIASNSRFIAIYSNSKLKLFNKATLTLAREIEEPGCYNFNLHSNFIFLCSGQSLFSYNLSTFMKSEISSSKTKITTLFSIDNLLHVGFETGLINVYVFNEHVCKFSRSFQHSGPIISMASDRVNTYVSDYRNKITMYPEVRSFDFTGPKLYFKKYIFCTSENSVYTRSNGTFGLLFSVNETIEDLVFSEQGGLFFLKTERGIGCYDMIGNERTHSLSKDFTVINKNGKCFIAYEKNGKIELEDTYINDNAMEEIVFSKLNIAEIPVEGKEFDEKHAGKSIFIDDGFKRQIRSKKTARGVRKSISKYSESSEREESEDELFDSEVENNSEINKCNADEYSIKNYPVKKYSSDLPSFNNNYKTNPREDSTTLLFYSREGYMISLQSDLSCQVSIHYHDRMATTIQFKDKEKSRLGCFYNDKFLLSSGELLNFNDVWQHKILSKFIGLNNKHIFSMDENILSIFDYSGKLVKEMLVCCPSSLCVSDGQIAIFSESNLLLIEDHFLTNATYIPVKNVEFSCFDNKTLYIKSNDSLFRLENGVFVRILKLKELPLTINGDELITLAEPIKLLPVPEINHFPFENKMPEMIDLGNDYEIKFNPYKNR